MAEKDIKELRKLSPEERIKKLKELQEKGKKEIAEAQKMISESEEQIAKEQELKDIPIPQLKSVSIDELFTAEEKALFKAKRFVEERIPAEEKIEKPPEAKPLEAVAEEAPRLTEAEEQAHIHYQVQAQQEAQRAAGDLYNEMRNIYNEVRETGEITPEQLDRVRIIQYADIEKVEQMRRGDYSPTESQAVARRLVASQRIGDWLNRFYRGAA